MIEIDERLVDSLAPNANAIKNGRGLLAKGKLLALNQSGDGSLLFGECAGSGKSNYHCSVDYVKTDAPVFRCSCPSRQFPCKHCLALLYARAAGKPFAAAEIPDDVASKREKIATRAVKKKAAANTPKKVNKAALKKKIDAQLGGLDLLETLLHDLVRSGIGNYSGKTAKSIQGEAKQLGDTYLPGAQGALLELLEILDAADSTSAREASYTAALDQLTRIHAVIKQGRNYLQNRLGDPELKPDTESSIAAWLGHAWKLEELGAAGMVENEVTMLQLAFSCRDNTARKEFVDVGTWLNLTTGAVQQTHNIRPYRAAKYIKEEDSYFGVAQVGELFRYPGDLNPRIRWESMEPRNAVPADFKKAQSHAREGFAAVLKEVKSQLKVPLASKRPEMLVSFEKIGQIGEALVAEDAAGDRITLADEATGREPSTVHFLNLLPPEALGKQSFLLRFHHDLDTGQLRAKPLSILTKDAVIRLSY